MNQEQTARATATTLVCKCFAMATASDGNTIPLTLREHLIDAVAELARRASSAESERDEARGRCRTLSEEVRARRRRGLHANLKPSSTATENWREWESTDSALCLEVIEAVAKTDTTSALTPPEGTQP